MRQPEYGEGYGDQIQIDNEYGLVNKISCSPRKNGLPGFEGYTESLGAENEK
jgi:hypothetical protein